MTTAAWSWLMCKNVTTRLINTSRRTTEERREWNKVCGFKLTGHGGVSFGSTQLLLSHIFIGDGLHNIRSCDEQVRCVLHARTHAHRTFVSSMMVFIILSYKNTSGRVIEQDVHIFLPSPWKWNPSGRESRQLLLHRDPWWGRSGGRLLKPAHSSG